MIKLDRFLKFLPFLFLLNEMIVALPRAKPLYSSEELKIDFSGYLQEQVLHSPNFFGESFELSQTRFRPVLSFNFGRGFSAELSQSLQVSSGSAVNNPFFVLSSKIPGQSYFKWEKRLMEEGFWLDYSIYRAWLAYEDEKMKLVAGRQRIALGYAYFYSPLDLFNPVSPLSLEPGERVGVDGLSLELDFSPTSYLLLAYGAGEAIDQSRFVSYFKTTVKSYDLQFLAGRIFTDYVLGFAFSGYVKEGGFYGEASYTMPLEEDYFFRSTIGYQYRFKNSLLLILEYYYNEKLVEEGMETLTFLSSQSGLLTLNRNFLALALGFDPSPLLHLSSAIIYELDQGSFFFGPSLSYSAPYSLSLSLGAQLFRGNEKGDFGFLPNFLWARLRWDF